MPRGADGASDRRRRLPQVLLRMHGGDKHRFELRGRDVLARIEHSGKITRERRPVAGGTGDIADMPDLLCLYHHLGLEFLRRTLFGILGGTQ